MCLEPKISCSQTAFVNKPTLLSKSHKLNYDRVLGVVIPKFGYNYQL